MTGKLPYDVALSESHDDEVVTPLTVDILLITSLFLNVSALAELPLNIEPTAPAAMPIGVILNAPLARFMAPPAIFFRNPPAAFFILLPLNIDRGVDLPPNTDASFADSAKIACDAAVGTGNVDRNPVVTSVSIVPTCLSKLWNTGPNLECGTTSSGSPPSAINACVGELTSPPSFKHAFACFGARSFAISAESIPIDIAVPAPGIVDATPDATSIRAPAGSPLRSL